MAEYLLERYGVDGSVRWAMAGRNDSKLAVVRDELGPSAGEVPILTADSHDRASLDALVRRTRVICTTVGPYAKYGSELVAACVGSGTHYCDLAGEVQWMRAMIDTHQGDAQDSGARIVHTCGFDSIPSDMGVRFMQAEAQKRFGTPFGEIKYRVKALRGGPSGGTVASLLNAVDEAGDDRAVARILADPYALNPPGQREGPDGRDQQTLLYDRDVGAWTAPFVMAGINTRVVRRTNALLGYPYGRDFRYSEATLMGDGVAGWMKAAATTGGLGAFMLAVQAAPLRRLLERTVLPAPGDGPNRQQRETGFFNIVLAGILDDGEVVTGRVTGDRDPGYGSTSKMLAESAVCLAQDELDVGGGFWTPASAMGDQLLKRLTGNAGLAFRIDEA